MKFRFINQRWDQSTTAFDVVLNSMPLQNRTLIER